MVDIRWLPPGVAEAGARSARALVDAVKRAEFAPGSTIWLAVTGLSRSGKTVFTTSLIHNLLSAAHNPNRMPLLGVAGERRLISSRLEDAGAGQLKRFPYERNIEAMATGAPDWPARTDDISEIGIRLQFAPANAAGRLLAGMTGGTSSVILRIIDYPGEWLLDLPLMSQSYAEWSRETLRLNRQGIRAEVARDYLAFLAEHRHDEPASEETARRAHDLYRALLVTARDRHGLTFLQPGRFLCPGDLGDVPYLRFAPLDVPEGVESFTPNTLGALMAARFEVYKRDVVARFYEQHFRFYSRQIVLVDVLRALLAGRDAFEDARRALVALRQSFRFGGGGILSKLLWGWHIDKVLFAATKADHVPEVQRDHLAELLRNMAAVPLGEIKSSHARIDTTALASVISTAEGVREIGGQRVQVVIGRPVGSNKQAEFFVGNIPIRPPRRELWDAPFLNIPTFEPPAIDPSPIEGIPHINLDLALDFLLGDRLR